ncbi:ABC transporter transmembrane domain-containing protein [Corynebacterium anserum]|uniref:ATP-binding cassette domain-containing protein n=1 Tax=Corynebacterium anserum TaxID=2684406 RepID=A0A7G7YLX9_9CORY|nr:ABC transporter ATP-binding protein [Corynebacterium anserum]MBC2681334.1 ATP-binding cassette domain-containing protein [Corynebacterium anserum]QNH95499.1 ATP-binding cassette domain-containing protein [Corynebacterium anserum]
MVDDPSKIPSSDDPKWLLKTTLSQRPWTHIAALGVLLNFLCNATVPIIVGKAIDDAVATSHYARLIHWLLLLAIVFAVSTASMYFGRYIMTRSMLLVNHQLRTMVTDRIQDPKGFRGKDRTAGGLLSVASNDTTKVADVMFLAVFPVAEIGSLIYMSVVVLTIHVPLGIGVLVAGPIVVMIALRAAQPLRAQSGERQRAVAKTASMATDLVQGLRILKGLGAIASVNKRYTAQSTQAYEATVGANKAQAALNGVTESTGALYVAVVGVFAGWLGLKGQITIGELITVVGMTQFIITPMTMLGKNIAEKVATGQASAQRILDVLNAPAEQRAPIDDEEMNRLLTQIDEGLTVVSGDEALSLVDTLDRMSTTRVIVAPHAADLFDASVADNVHPDRDTALWALEVAAVTDIPGGPDKRVGEGGNQLSGGQRQRVALARAIAANPDVLVLQDPTTAVDSITEQRIAERVTAARAGRRTIVVTQAPAWRAEANHCV